LAASSKVNSIDDYRKRMLREMNSTNYIKPYNPVLQA
jgi:hypothetical protein